MSDRSRLGRITIRQREILVNFLEENPEVIGGKFTPTFPKEKQDALWSELVSWLNSEGPPKKPTVALWKKSLQDWKINTVNKAREYRRQQGAGGSISDPTKKLSDLERRLMNLTNGWRKISDKTTQGDAVSLESQNPAERKFIARPVILKQVTMEGENGNIEDESNEDVEDGASNTENNATTTDTVPPPMYEVILNIDNTLELSEQSYEMPSTSEKDNGKTAYSTSNKAHSTVDHDANAGPSTHESSARSKAYEIRQKFLKECARRRTAQRLLQGKSRAAETTSTVLSRLFESRDSVYWEIKNVMMRQAVAFEQMVELQRRGVEAQEDLAGAALIQAEAAKKQADAISRLADTLGKG